MGKSTKAIERANIKIENHVKLENVQQEDKQPQTLKKDQFQKISPNHKKKIIKKNTKNNRIIIRNLVYDINKKHISKLLNKFGQIKDINIPFNPDGKCSKGYAFVQFMSRNQCLKVIKDLNGTTFKGRTIILDFSVAKQVYLKSQLNQPIHKALDNLKIAEEDSVKNEEKQNQPQEQESQLQEQEYKQKYQEINQIKPQRQAQNLCSTIFIRSLPMSVTDEKLYKFMRSYGKIAFARVVKDKSTNMSKGTAFVKFKQTDVAHRLIQYSWSYEMHVLNKNPHFKQNPTINLEFDGTIIKIFKAQSRQHIQETLENRNEKDDNKKKKPIKKVKNIEELIKYDSNNKRNLQFAIYGQWKPQQQMNQNDYEKFKNHEKQKIEKLKNPNNIISTKRIILKYLNKNISEYEIKQFCKEFLKEYNLSIHDLLQCRLILDQSRNHSAGFCFIQFKKKSIALNFISWLHQHYQQIMNNYFVYQFAIQDVRKQINKTKKIVKNRKNLYQTKKF